MSEAIEKVELLPCPFCGGMPEVAHNTDGDYEVYCNNEGCLIYTYIALPSLDEAANVWNERPHTKGTKDTKGRSLAMSERVKTKAVLTTYYNRDPLELVVEKPAGDWMALDNFLLALGFSRLNMHGVRAVGRFRFLTRSDRELETVERIVMAGAAYLTSYNFEITFQC